MSPQTITANNINNLPSSHITAFLPDNNGETSNVLKSFKGIVDEKIESGEKFVSYKVSDKNDPNYVFKVLSYKKDYLPLDNMSFLEMHEDVEEGDVVSIQGFVARSKKGNPYIRATTILVNEYGNNEYETTDHEGDDEEDDSESDPDYTPSESSEEEEEIEEEEIEEEEIEEEETVHGNYQPTVQELLETHFEIPTIPLTIYNQFVQYQSMYFSIESVRTNTPFKLVLKTQIADFHITKMDSKIIGVFVSENPLEPDHPNGYDMILSGKFRNLLKILI
jgi:hypothetical protein